MGQGFVGDIVKIHFEVVLVIGAGGRAEERLHSHGAGGVGVVVKAYS